MGTFFLHSCVKLSEMNIRHCFFKSLSKGNVIYHFTESCESRLIFVVKVTKVLDVKLQEIMSIPFMVVYPFSLDKIKSHPTSFLAENSISL